MAYVLWQIFPILEHLLFFYYEAFFEMDFCIEQFCCGSRNVFCMFFNVLFFTQIDEFVRALAHVLSQIFPILERLLFFECWGLLESPFADKNSVVALETFFPCFWGV